MNAGRWVLLMLACGLSVEALNGKESNPPDKTDKVGYVDCSSRKLKLPATAYLDLCQKQPVGSLSCGQGVTVVQRHAYLLEVALSDGSLRYVSATVISRNAKKFVPFGLDSGLKDVGRPDCPSDLGVDEERLAGIKDRPPRAFYRPDPEYSDLARKKKISGHVVLSFTVGTDGLPHDIQVEKGLGYGLDENAVETLSTWKFRPAFKNGEPVEAHLKVEMTFELF